MWLGSVLVGCTPGSFALPVPWLDVPATVTVDVSFGRPNTIGVEVHNSGTAPAEVTAEVQAPLVVAADTIDIAPGATAAIPVSYTPTTYDAVTVPLTLRTAVERHRVLLAILVNPDADDDGHLAIGAGGDDCDDDDPERWPGAPETCDGLDQDCDDDIDEDPIDPWSWLPDSDRDGFGDASGAPVVACEGPAGWVLDDQDCDDSRPDVSPAATELWYDGVDQDCDGADDYDQDRDGYSSAAYGGDDCSDTASSVHPGATEIWYDGTDQDCDGNDDDQDLDGVPGGVAGADCDDLVATTYPGAPELDDGLDQDCDGWRDEGLWAAGVLLVTEIHEDPGAVADGDGRFVELYNSSDGDVDLGAVDVAIGVQSTGLAAGFLAPGAVAVLCANADDAANGGLACDGEIAWPGPADAIEVHGDGIELDVVDWSGWSFTEGASRELGAAHLDPVSNDDEANWCTASAIYGLGDLGTPGAVVSPCP